MKGKKSLKEFFLKISTIFFSGQEDYTTSKLHSKNYWAQYTNSWSCNIKSMFIETTFVP